MTRRPIRLMSLVLAAAGLIQAAVAALSSPTPDGATCSACGPIGGAYCPLNLPAD